MSRNPKELHPIDGYRVDLFQFTPESWARVKGDILRIEQICFDGKGYSEETFEKDFSRPEAAVVILRNHTGKIIGYSYALPVNIEEPEREEEKDETANIDSTAIHPDYQGQGLVGILIGKLEEELRKRGFKFIEREAVIGNGYADSIQRHYRDRVLGWRDQDSKYGPQRFFRIRL